MFFTSEVQLTVFFGGTRHVFYQYQQNVLGSQRLQPVMLSTLHSQSAIISQPAHTMNHPTIVYFTRSAGTVRHQLAMSGLITSAEFDGALGGRRQGRTQPGLTLTLPELVGCV